MPLEIREMVIRTQINENMSPSENEEKTKKEKDCNCQEAANAAVAEQMTEIFNRKKER